MYFEMTPEQPQSVSKSELQIIIQLIKSRNMGYWEDQHAQRNLYGMV
jgi:hypothetical protein